MSWEEAEKGEPVRYFLSSSDWSDEADPGWGPGVESKEHSELFRRKER